MNEYDFSLSPCLHFISQVPLSDSVQHLQQEGPGCQSGERCRHVFVQHARGQSALRGPEMRQRLRGGRRRVRLRGARGEIRSHLFISCFQHSFSSALLLGGGAKIFFAIQIIKVLYKLGGNANGGATSIAVFQLHIVGLA